MTEEELTQKIEEAKGKGASDEDIAKIFALAFKNGDLDREQFEACLSKIGFGLSDEAKGLSDEELREKVIVSDENEAQEGMEEEAEKAKEGEGPLAPGVKKEVEGEGEAKPESKPEEEEESDEDKAYRLANLKKEAKHDESKAKTEESDEEDDEEKAFRLAGLRK